MSKQIDERIVSMQFDNKHFESNVQTSMSTLDKLKAKLNLSGASKGLENVNSAAKKVDMSGLAGGVETVSAKFSALQVVGVTALANITNSAINAGKRMVSALTIDPVKTGFQEYETQLNAVQTIMANVGHKGKTLDDVNAALDELNKYADQTIYNFTEMTRNIGLFTNAGVDLDTSVAAIKGFSNAAAMAGTNATDTSRAMYQLSQAMSSGSVKLLDWKSLETANITGERFQETIKETAKVHGINVDAMIEEEGNFRETLASGWLTAELMAEALNHYTLSRETMTKAEQEAAKAQMRSAGYTAEQIEKLFDLGTEANNAATKVKSLTQLWDVLKESAQSGWSKTWQIIIGDFEQAKALFTPLANFLTGAIDKMSDFRNNLLKGALSFDPWQSILDKLENSPIGKVKDKIDAVKELTESVQYYRDVVTKVWRGDYNNRGDNPDRYDLLRKAGYNPKVVQSLVNLGYDYRNKITEDDIVAAYKNAGVEMVKTTEKSKTATEDLGKAFDKLSDKQLKSIGFTDEEIKLFRELEAEAKRLGIPIDDLLKKMEETDGRTLLINSLKNAGSGLVGVFTALKNAWVDIFPPISSVRLYTLIDGFHEFTKCLRLTDAKTGELTETGKNLQRTFKGIFAALDIVLTIVGGPIKIAFKLLVQLLSVFDLNILDVTAGVGDAIVAFRDWLDSVLDFTGVFKWLAPYATKAGKAIKEWFIGLKDSETVKMLAEYLKMAKDAVVDWFKGLKDSATIKKFVDYLKSAKDAIVDWFKGLKDAENIPRYIFSGLLNGLSGGIKEVINFVINIGKKILEAIKSVLGIHSPSTEFYDIGKNIMLGLFNGISEFVKMVYDLVMSIGTKLGDIIKNLDLGSIFTILTGGGLMYSFITIARAVDALVDPLDHVDDCIVQVKKTLKDFRGVLKALKLNIAAEAIKTLAISIAILAGSIAVLSLLDQGKMWSAVGAIAVLMGLLAGLTFIVGKFGPKEGLEFGKIALALLGLSAAMLIMAWALKSIASIDSDKFTQAVIGLSGAMALVIAAMIVVSKGGPAVAKAGGTFTSMAWALLLMAGVAKILGNMSQDELIQGGIAIAAFSAIIVGLMAATRLIAGSKNVDRIGSTILKISGAILLMAITAKIAASMKPEELIQGGLAIAAFAGIIVGLMAATKLISGSTNVGKIGSAIFGVAGAILVMILVAKLAASMEPADIIKGTLAVAAFAGIIVGLMAATKLVTGSKNIDKIGKTLLAVSVSIGVLAITAALLSLIDIGNLAKGVVAVGILSVIMAGLIFVTKFANNVTGTIVGITAAIAVLAISAAALSMVDPGRLAGATIALGALLGMFALVIKMTGTVEKAMGTLIVLTIAIAVLAGALYLVAQLPVGTALGASLALSILMGTMAGVLLILSKMGPGATKALIGVVGLLALCVPLLALVGILAIMQHVQNAAANAAILAGFATVLTLLLVPLTVVGLIYTATGGMAMLGIVGLLALCVPLLALVGMLAIMQNIQNAMANTLVLTTLMGAMTSMLVVLAIVGPLALVGVGAMAALTGLIIALGTFAIGVGALMQRFPALQSFLDTGIPVLIQMAGALGEMIGAFIGGIAQQIASTLPSIGLSLSQFMINATPFIMGAKMVDETVLKGVGILAGAIALLTAVDLLENIVSFLNGGVSFSTLGTELSMFITNAMPFINGAKMIDPSIMEGVKTLAEAILVLTGANLVEQITSWLGGESSLATFGSQLGQLGTDLSTFVTNLGTFTEDQVTTIDCAGRAIKALADSASTIPNEGGLWASIVGENSLATFGSSLPQLATDLSSFVANLGTFTEDQVTTIDCAGRAIKALADAAATIPNEGGLWASIVGENSLATFSSTLPQLGKDLSGFISNLGTFDESSIATVDCAGRAIKALAEAAKTIPNEGGFWAKIAGDNSLATFGSKLPQLGKDIAGFVSGLGTFGEEQIATVNAACGAIKSIAKLGEIDLSDTSSGLSKLGKKLEKFAEYIADFVTAIGDVGADSISSAIKKTKDIIDLAKTAARTNVESLGTFGKSLKKVATDGVKGFVKEFSGESPKDKARKATKAMLDAAIKGAEDKKSDVKKKFKSVAEAALKELESKTLKSSFTSAGKDLVTGFANGIKNNKSLATDAGSALGKAALKAAKEALDENSPSKEMYKVGDFAGQGFVNALFDYESKAGKAGTTLAESSIGGLNNAIAKISDFINSDIDAEPTIRPVLDLSDVRSGVSAIGSMFSGRRTLAVNTGTVGTIAASMAGFQNGNNSDEIVSSIKALRKDMAEMPRESISIGGITYDGDSAVADAVQTLVRAAKMERRT